MSHWVLFVGILSPAANPNPNLDKETLAQLLEAAYAPIQDFYCEYEGQTTFPQQVGNEKLGRDGLFDVFSGAFISRRDGALLVDIYHQHHYKDANPMLRDTIAVLSGQSEQYQRSVDSPDGRGQITPARYRESDTEGSFGRVYCDRLLFGYLRHPDWTMTSEAPEKIDGQECLVVTFHRVGPGETEPSYIERFWIDLGRGGHALRREVYHSGGKRANSMEDIVLRPFQDSRGTTVWLPVSGVYKSFIHLGEHNERIYGSQPTNLETYSALQESIRLNQSIPDERFSVKFRNGTLITDTLRRARYEFGQAREPETKRMTQAEVEAQLEEQLRIADVQGDELRAASWERGNRGWSAWLPATLVGGSLAILVVLVARRYLA